MSRPGAHRPARARRGWPLALGAALGLLLGSGAPRPGEAASGPGGPLPLFVSPPTVPRAWQPQAEALRLQLTARLLQTGAFAEAVGPQDRAAVDACLRQVNRDVHDETCWIRLGLGQGAQALATTELSAAEGGCLLVVKLLAIETRATQRMHAQVVPGCSAAALEDELGRAARTLAGLTPPTPAVPVTDADKGEPPAVGALVVEVVPPGARVTLQRLPRGAPTGGEAAPGEDAPPALLEALAPYRNLALPGGRWRVDLRAPGRAARTHVVEVLPGRTTLLREELPEPLAIVVRGEPAGAQVEVSGPDGFYAQAELPARLEAGGPGGYQVTVSAAGHQRAVRQVWLVAAVPVAELEVGLRPSAPPAAPAEGREAARPILLGVAVSAAPLAGMTGVQVSVLGIHQPQPGGWGPTLRALTIGWSTTGQASGWTGSLLELGASRNFGDASVGLSLPLLGAGVLPSGEGPSWHYNVLAPLRLEARTHVYESSHLALGLLLPLYWVHERQGDTAEPQRYGGTVPLQTYLEVGW